jgi:hypothetical protein
MRSVKLFQLCVLLVIVLGMAPMSYALTCPNKPANAATLATVHFDTNDGEGQMWDLYPGAGTITSISGSEGNVSASILSPGNNVGGQQVIWPKPGNQQPLTNTYVCFRWKMNSQFVGIRTANKLFFVAAQDWTFGKAGNNAFFGVKPFDTSNYPSSSVPFFMFFGHNSGNLDNSHTCSLDLGLQCNPNAASIPLYPDTWYTVEAYSIASSSLTSRNGGVKWWINGTLNGNYTNLNYGDGIINQFQINHTWDGSSAIQCYNAATNPLGRDCTNPQIHYFDELLVASVGGIPAGSGGSTSPTPPPTPPSPPPTTGMPNLPSGATILLDCAFNSITCSGLVGNPYNAGQIMTDLSAPVSPPNIYRHSRCATCLHGGTQLDFSHTQSTEVYTGLVLRTSPIFRGLDSGANKIVLPGSNISNSVLALYGQKGPDGGSGSFQLYWNDQNGGTVNNCHHSTNVVAGGTVANGPTVFGDCPGGLNYFANVGNGAFSLGQWHYAEWCGKASSSFTSRDGIYKWFLDGAMIGHYPNVNTGSYWNANYITPTWDGQGTPWGADAWYDIDRWVVARLPAGSCAALGGGAVPPSPPPSTPPPPPSTPPPPPAGTPGTVADLAITPQSTTTAKMTFTAVNGGNGVPAKYDNRLSLSPINWGSASSISSGQCASPFAPSQLIGQQIECLITGLTAGQTYQGQNVAFRGTMNAGATYGSLGNIASFTMPSSNEPTIANFAPASGITGASVTITGVNFGATIGANTVKFNGQTAIVTVASTTSLTVTVPDGVTTGRISVQTDQGIVYSEQNFTVGGSGGGCGCS